MAVDDFEHKHLKLALHLQDTGCKARLAYFGNYHHVNAAVVNDTMRTRDAPPAFLPYCVADSLIALKRKAPRAALFAFLDELLPYMRKRPPKRQLSLGRYIGRRLEEYRPDNR